MIQVLEATKINGKKNMNEYLKWGLNEFYKTHNAGKKKWKLLYIKKGKSMNEIKKKMIKKWERYSEYFSG